MTDQPTGYMIQGFFFQEGTYFDTAIVAIEGAVVVVRESMFRDLFSGLFGPSESGEWTGTMLDSCGRSSLTNVWISPNHFGYDKRYEHRTDVVNYDFRLHENGLWVGSYSGDAVGTGQATCILTPITKQMLKPTQ